METLKEVLEASGSCEAAEAAYFSHQIDPNRPSTGNRGLVSGDGLG
jgi:hypothetical protein